MQITAEIPNITQQLSQARENFSLGHNNKFNQNENKFSTEKTSETKLWEKARNIAEIVCSRESIFRSALDLTGWEIPMILAALTRNLYSTAEAVYQAVYSLSTMIMTPYFTKWIGHLVGKTILKADEAKDINHYMLFQMHDLDNHDTLMQGLQRIKEEEPEDLGFVATLYKDSKSKEARYLEKAKSIKDFANSFTLDEGKLERIKKLKRSTIQGASFIEGCLWGSQYLTNRMFRKYILGQNSFTGTINYDTKDSTKKTDASKLKWWQIVGNIAAMFSSPVINYFLLNKLEDKEAVKKSPWLQTIKNQWDMTHGIFPKLGLMVSFMMIPNSLGMLFSSQGKNEFFENLLTLSTVMQSWWFGHNLTNGSLAQRADIKLVEKFGLDRGILVEPRDANLLMPEPAKIQHVLRKVRHNPKLEKEAREMHAKVLYQGFTLHALLIFGMKMLINQVTKWRVGKAK